MAAKIDMICPLIKEPCLRKKCICYDVVKEDYWGDSCEPYGRCTHFKVAFDDETLLKEEGE